MSSIPQLTMFPLYPGGPQVRGKGYMNANSSFYTKATQFTPAYAVNIPPNSNPVNPNTFYQLNNQGTVSQRPIGQATAYNAPLAFDGSVLGGLKQAAVPAVAPPIPVALPLGYRCCRLLNTGGGGSLA